MTAVERTRSRAAALSVRSALALLLCAVAMVACFSADEEPALAASTGSGVDAALAQTGSGETGDESEVINSAPIEVPRDVVHVEETATLLGESEAAEGSLWIGSNGGIVVAGEMTVLFPPTAMPTPAMATAKVLPSATELIEPPIPGTILAAFSAVPANPGYVRAIQVTVPLNRAVEPGLPLELLGWQPSMRSYLVIGNANASADGTRAVFSVRQLGQMYVRAAPLVREGADERCAGVNIAFRRSWPGSSEDSVVGLVPETERLDRARAFNVLTDFRLSDFMQLVDFKNEEVRENAATRRSELAHVDEDYLMDPNAAAALAVLGRLVEREWVDPLSGLPAYRVRVTESYDALIEHSVRSTHYEGRAIDLTLSPVPAANGEERRDRYGRLSRLSVCAGFDYVLFENEYHVHASVLPTRVALVVEDDEGRRSVVTAKLSALDAFSPAISAVVPPSHYADFAWTASGTFEFPGTGRVLADTAFASTNTAPRPVTSTHDGLRRVVVYDDHAWLVNSGPIPQPGVLADEGATVDVLYPFPIADLDVGGRIVDAAFLVHHRTAAAVRTYFGGH